MKEIIDFTNQVVDQAKHLDDIIDNYLESVKDYTDTAGDLALPIKGALSVINHVKLRKFKAFLKSYGSKLNLDIDSRSEATEQLKKYLSKEKNLNFLYDSIENAINAKSIHSSTALGAYAGKILSKHANVTYKDLIIIDALRSLNDIDLELFIKIYDVADLAKPVSIKEYEELKPFQMLCEKIVHKLKTIQVLEEEEAGTFDSVGSGWGKFVSTDIAVELFQLLKTTGVYDMIKRDSIL